MAQLGARLDGIEEVVGSNPIGSTKLPYHFLYSLQRNFLLGTDRPKLNLQKLLIRPWAHNGNARRRRSASDGVRKLR